MEQETKMMWILEKILSEQEKILSEQEKMLSEQEKTNQRLEKLEVGQIRLEKDVQFVKETVIHLENDQGQKITALFDGYSLNRDFASEQAPRMTKLEQRVDKLEVDVIHIKVAQAK